MSISTASQNQSLAQSNKFRLVFERLPNVTFFCQETSIPGIAISNATYATPFTDLPVPGDKVQFDSLRMSFLIDEDYLTWFSIYDWITGVAFPRSFEQYRNIVDKTQLKPPVLRREAVQYSDASLTVYSNKNNPAFKLKFVDVFPVSLSPVELDVRNDANHILIGQAEFKYSYFIRA